VEEAMSALDEAREAWAAGAVKASGRPRFALNGELLDRCYSPSDVTDEDEFLAKVGFPGSFPYTRGVYPAMYRDRLWQMRLYSGFGTAEDSNKRWRYLLARGNNGVSVAFDLPTQCGLDSDHPDAGAEVGRVGLAIDSWRDFDIAFDGLPIDKLGISLNAHSTAPMVLSLFLAMCERRGIQPGQISGSMTTDVLKDYVARGTWVFPPSAGLRLVGDILEFATKEMPRFYPLVIRGPDMRDAGADAAMEVGFAFANAIAYLEYAQLRGLDIDAFAPRLSAQFYYYGDFLQEAAKTRAARRMWARLLTERFGAKSKNSVLLRVTASVGGTHFQAYEPEINIIRGTLGCLGAVLGGTQGMLLAGYDEAFGIPTEDTARIALRTQQIVGYESDATAVADPLGGSYFIEALTDKIEAVVLAKIKEIEELGGAVAAIESGHMQREIANAAYEREIEEQQGERPLVGVNLFAQEGGPRELVVHAPDPAVRERQVARLQELRASRDQARVDNTLRSLRGAAQTEETNLLPLMIDCARAEATLGEMVDTLRGVFGEFVEPSL
jgi:methylmalonyl-CoA mutase, N-terminal domain